MKILYTGAALILTAFIAIANSWNSSASEDLSPSETVRQYYKLALDGKTEEAMTFWSDCNITPQGFCSRSASTSGEDTHEQWTKGIHKYKDDFTIEEQKVEENQASVLVHTKLSNGFMLKTIYKLIKADGKWKLYVLSSPAMEEADRESK